MEDEASVFKRQSLNAIKRRRYIKKYTFITLIIIALLMFAAVVFAYIIDR